MNTAVEKISMAILKSKRTVALTGAGISTESGIPDFRGESGKFWAQYDIKDFYLSNFIRDSESRMRCWEACAKFYKIIRNAQPNSAHYTLAELGKKKLLSGIITQNVDGLHQRAGSNPKTVVEIHGTAHSISCLDCGRKYNCERIYASIDRGTKIPYCEHCQGILKSDTVFTEEAILPDVARRAVMMVDSSELLIVIGSSLEVQPAAYLPVKAKEVRAKLAIINLTPTPYDKYADYLIYGLASDTLSMILKQVKLYTAPRRGEKIPKLGG